MATGGVRPPPVPADVYDAALAVACGGGAARERELVRWYAGDDDPVPAAAARRVIQWAVERGVARECVR